MSALLFNSYTEKLVQETNTFGMIYYVEDICETILVYAGGIVLQAQIRRTMQCLSNVFSELGTT